MGGIFDDLEEEDREARLARAVYSCICCGAAVRTITAYYGQACNLLAPSRYRRASRGGGNRRRYFSPIFTLFRITGRLYVLCCLSRLPACAARHITANALCKAESNPAIQLSCCCAVLPCLSPSVPGPLGAGNTVTLRSPSRLCVAEPAGIRVTKRSTLVPQHSHRGCNVKGTRHAVLLISSS